MKDLVNLKNSLSGGDSSNGLPGTNFHQPHVTFHYINPILENKQNTLCQMKNAF